MENIKAWERKCDVKYRYQGGLGAQKEIKAEEL